MESFLAYSLFLSVGHNSSSLNVPNTLEYGLLVIIGILLITVFLIKRKIKGLKQEVKSLKEENQQLNNKVDFKNKELENFALRLTEKNKFLEEIKTNISNIKGKEENTQKLKSLSSAIKQNLYIDKDRNEFNQYVDQISQSFFQKLKEHFPTLTKNEKRLCSLLVLELSTKDIASLLNVSEYGVKKARYRLRKKLGLQREDNVSQFLNNL